MSEAKKPINNNHIDQAQRFLDKEGAHDWEIIVANDTELQLDFDSEREPERFLEVFGIFTEQYPIIGLRRTISKSGKGLHIRIYLQQPMEIIQRIAWQAALGSDVTREALSLISVAKGWLNPILLFEKRKDPNA